MPPPGNRNLRILQEGIIKNRNYIKQINTKFKEELEQQKRYIDTIKNTIGDDNIKRDESIGEIRQNLDLLGNFVTEKLSNHPRDFENFVRNQPNQGGRRKTRKRKRRRKSRKMRKTKRRRKRRRKKSKKVRRK